MPILSGGLITAPPVEDEVQTPITRAWTEDYGTIRATWIDPYGVELELSNTAWDSPVFTTDGPAGWGAPPVEIVTDPLPRGGDQVRFIRNEPRRIQWPLYIGDETSHEVFVGHYRSIVESITSTTEAGAPAWLRIYRPNGRYRQIACYYEQGLEGEAGENHRWAKPVVTLFCPDGFWAGDRSVVASRSFVASGDTSGVLTRNFFNPFFNLKSSKVSTGSPDDPAVPINNPGSVAAWPVWKITGPMSKLTAANLTVGTRFALTYTLTEGQTITITTNRPSVRGPGDANLSRFVDWFNPAGTELWPLKRGDNQIQFQVDGAGDGTNVQLSFTPRYQTA